ncbi:hypothetical protein ACIBAG_28955 [Streptomyces sp. NPDC051243]|uniref:hypothetical protein n=1 Tax=Streptomyces sp. NPDC051243 TaxID=3365646 RepID=UPI0037B3E75C
MRGQILADDATTCLALADPGHTRTVRAAESESSQVYTPFEGFELTVRVTDTFLRGGHILRAGRIAGEPVGAQPHSPTPGA